ncbi:hypothetical protein KHQ81_03365 [Mycoplasmatota bacterium]|nr:hypothetical protein KHQ81_03365 [Mycoplasmatota bacterium]
MGIKQYRLLTFYQDKSFKDTKKILYNQFYLYIVILLGFTAMSVTFLNRLDFLFNNSKNILITSFVIVPIIYFIIKSIYGLILLQESYQSFHYKLINEFSLLYILGYHIILLSFFENNLVYCYESLLLILIGFIFQRFKNEIIILIAIVLTVCSLYFLSSFCVFNIYLIIITFIFTLFMLYPIVFILDKEIDKEIELIMLGNKNNPNGKIKDFLRKIK